MRLHRVGVSGQTAMSRKVTRKVDTKGHGQHRRSARMRNTAAETVATMATAIPIKRMVTRAVWTQNGYVAGR